MCAKNKNVDRETATLGGELIHVIDSVIKDKGISREVLVEALESALLTAAHKKLGSHRELEAHFNEDLGEIELFEFKDVVEEVDDEFTQVSLEQGRGLDPRRRAADDLQRVQGPGRRDHRRHRAPLRKGKHDHRPRPDRGHPAQKRTGPPRKLPGRRPGPRLYPPGPPGVQGRESSTSRPWPANPGSGRKSR